MQRMPAGSSPSRLSRRGPAVRSGAASRARFGTSATTRAAVSTRRCGQSLAHLRDLSLEGIVWTCLDGPVQQPKCFEGVDLVVLLQLEEVTFGKLSYVPLVFELEDRDQGASLLLFELD